MGRLLRDKKTVLNLRGECEVVIERIFDAPRDLVYRSLTDPELIPEWWGPRRLTTEVVQMEVRDGGFWRFVQHDSGSEYGFHGEYLEVTPGERIVNTFIYDRQPDDLVIDSIELHDELGGRTKLVQVTEFADEGARDSMLGPGMDLGISDGNQRLDELFMRLGPLDLGRPAALGSFELLRDLSGTRCPSSGMRPATSPYLADWLATGSLELPDALRDLTSQSAPD